MAIDMTQFYQVFFDESAEHLEEMENLLLGLDIGQPEDEDLNAIFRAAHSIKGSSGTFGFEDLTRVTHILESLLDRLRKHELPLRASMVDAFLAAVDLLKALLAAHQGADPVPEAEVAALCGRLTALTDQSPTAAAATPTVASAPITTSLEASSAALADGAVGEEMRTWHLEFLPKSSSSSPSADRAALDQLLNDLAHNGAIRVEVLPEDGQLGVCRVNVTGPLDREPLVRSLAFLAEEGAWSVKQLDGMEGTAPSPATIAPAGSESTGDDPGYGFFSPLPEPGVEADSVSPSSLEGEGFGFFAPLPPRGAGEPASPGAEEGDGAYGFFAPLPGAEPAPQPAAAQPVAEEGDGYGFFEPLPVPVAEPAPVSPPETLPVVRQEEGALPAPVAPLHGEAREGAAKGRAPLADHASIRVGVEKVDQLINLVGELVITQSMLLATAQQMQESAPERLLNGLTQLERNSRDLQEAVMSIRMLPISFVFTRFPRVVRDLSAKLAKQVELKMSGENTELDKGLIERVADPLTHLIRNSLDHGIETPEKRQAAGKSPVGTITLRAAHQGGNVVIEVGDDGAGLNRQKILAKAREKGLPVSDQMSDQEVWQLIFEPGFSTADQVTDISGRGVGMDVVRRNIQSMGGRIEIQSMVGIGSRMIVRLPLTLAILDGMSVGVGEETYIIPLSYVVESLQAAPETIKTVSHQGQVIQVRGEYLPVLALHQLLGGTPRYRELSDGILVVLAADGCKAALLVDELGGQHQVVIKSLEQNYRKVPGLSGATIMGDGRVAMILDVSALVGRVRGVNRE